jgi:16S rRNA (cytidine1402-2'-O)-methyltransferase
MFVGYPPHKQGHRLKFFQNLKKSQEAVKSTAILFEAPHKLIRTLEDLQGVMGDIPIVIARELTKVYEEIRRERISESLEHFQKTNPKGECIILFHQ